MHYSVSHHKLKLILAGQGIRSGDAAAIDALFGGLDGYYWYGTLRDMCPEGRTLSWDDQYAMVTAIQAHENATAGIAARSLKVPEIEQLILLDRAADRAAELIPLRRSAYNSR